MTSSTDGGLEPPATAAQIHAESPPAGETHQRTDESGAANRPAAFRQPKVLIIDDDDDLRSLLQIYMESGKRDAFHVDTAASLNEGLRQMESCKPDVVLLDLTLPDSAGLSTVERFVAHSGEIPVIVLTSRCDAELDHACLSAGAQDYIRKSDLSPKQLRRSAAFAIQRARVLSGLRTQPAAGDAPIGPRQRVLDSHLVGLVILHPDDLTVLDANDEALRTLGWDAPPPADEPFPLALPAEGPHRIHLAIDGKERCLELRRETIPWQAATALLVTVRDVTTQWTNERLLRLTDFSINQAADMALCLEQDGQIIFVNDSACRALGYSRDALLEKTIFDIDTSHPPDRWPDIFARTEQDQKVSIHSRYRKQDGQLLSVDVVINRITFDGREYPCLLARDVTERIRAEQQQKRHNASLNALTNTAMEFVRLPHDVDAFSYIACQAAQIIRHAGAVVVTEFAEESSQWTVRAHDGFDEADGELEQRLHPDACQLPGAHAAAAPEGVSSGRLLEVPDGVRGLATYGFPQPALTYLSDTRDYTHAFYIGLHRNETVFGYVLFLQRQDAPPLSRSLVETFAAVASMALERRRAEEALLLTEYSVENSEQIIMWLRRDGQVHYANRAACTGLGYCPSELADKSLFDIDVHCTEALWNRITSDKGETFEHFSHESEFRRKDQSVVPVQISATRLEFCGGRYVFLMASDITMQRQTEAAREQYQKDLRRQVNLQTQELREAKEVAEQSNQAKSDFLANMSHELRTPLNAIIGFSQMLAEQYVGPLNERQFGYVQDILDSGEHLLDLINDILDLSKVESGKLELSLSMVQVAPIIEHSTSMIAQKCHHHGIDLVLDLEPSLHDVHMAIDERMVKQVLFNLLTNAAKFTPDGGRIRLTGRCLPAPSEVEEIEVTVSDTGIGVAAEHRDRLFEPFYQVSGGTTDKTPGTGLGLPLSRQLVELHGGSLNLESPGLGEGCTVRFLLPVLTTLAPDPVQATALAVTTG